MPYLKSCTAVYNEHMKEMLVIAEEKLMSQEVEKWEKDLLS